MVTTPLVVVKTIARVGRGLFLTKDLEAHHLILLIPNVVTELEIELTFSSP